jgi:calcineurin-like phosphoesterase family protein
MRFFISDTHFGHKNIINYCSRPFQLVDEMNRVMKEQWNQTIGPDDEVFFVGDFAFLPAEETAELLQSLHGLKHMILGNHDEGRSRGFWKRHFETVESSRTITIEPIGKSVHLYHYPLFGPNRPQYMIHGHSHNYRPLITSYNTTGQLLINVSVEGLEYTPISETRISELIEQHDVYMKGDPSWKS